MRIYVGGLGENVQEDEIVKIFGSSEMGVVNSVEIIRSKGRSFAYLEFDPVSEKGIAKLFSKYNGCLWKGGRLRLEKAKEHYMIRLKREWADDAELQMDRDRKIADMEKSMQPMQKPKNSKDFENMQLNIFFPRLRKIKPMPFKGTGKHKYSFQRFEAPALPLHFCDCEEHCPSLELPKSKSTDDQATNASGMNEDEIKMMNSVLSKILGKENVSTVSSVEDKSNKQFNDEETIPADDLQNGDSESDQMSEDSLVINVVSRSSKKADPFENWGLRHNMAIDQVDSVISSGAINKSSSDANPRKKAKLLPTVHEKKSDPFTSSQRNPEKQVEEENKETTSTRDFLFENTGTDSRFDANPEVEDKASPHDCLVEKEQPIKDAELVENSALQPDNMSASKMDNYARGSSWTHNLSWSELVADLSNKPFRLSDFLPGKPVEKNEQQQVADSHQSSVPGEEKDAISVNDHHSTKVADKDFPHSYDGSLLPQSAICIDADEKIIDKTVEPSTTPGTGAHLVQQGIRAIGDNLVSETCSFMRSAASVKEWANAKAVLSASHKKRAKPEQ